ncbi:uncharacterized protein ATNIH1004_002169 [Aspergillus tanneri]|uniref:Protein kinase domain-containing protein n=1 Tax=Aspergillus tanneri TaxID=1220188 RepID=A0A5M9MRH7_9EURO|nr:uncharacterized protein ATNIH1004_002169 [Aspergillus tanneri]KAA8649498.1 hypothetical protein ATNIH1004_002169 [Aspergillus tanneri]
MSAGDAEQWVNLFFSQHPPSWINIAHVNEGGFEPFHTDRKWILWKQVTTDRRAGPDRIQVLRLAIKCNGRYVYKYVAKVFPEYTERDARAQLRRIPFKRDPRDVRDELDPFLNEARVFRRINNYCESSQRIYFPRFHGVITDLDDSKFFSGYFNRRAVVLEFIKPELSSRRILATREPDATERHWNFMLRLQSIVPSLSTFEVEYYCSLFIDRIRRLSALHNLAITHGDVRDDHFRLPGDFHDTVLYDFSVSYTFSSVPPYLINFRRPRSLKDISEYEQSCVEEQSNATGFSSSSYSVNWGP